MSGPVLVTSVSKAPEKESDGAFRFGGIQFAPIVDGRFYGHAPLRTLLELRAPGGSPINCSIEYVLAHLTDREQRVAMTDGISSTEFRNGVLLKSRTISTEKLGPGKYRLIVTARENGSGAVLASVSAPLEILNEASAHPVYVLSNLRGAASNGLASYIRGLAALAFQDRLAAGRYLRDALQRNPANTSARAALATLK
jgi:hypothetical protein